MAEKLKAIAASTSYADERARIVARIAELDDRLEYIEHMLAANRAVMLSRTCKLQDKVKQLRTALHLMNGGPEQ
jgi:hypothetical protein